MAHRTESNDDETKSYRQGAAAIMLVQLRAAGVEVKSPEDPFYVEGAFGAAVARGIIGPHNAREDSPSLVGRGEGALEGYDAQSAMVQRQKDAWKNRRPGRVADPESDPFGGASRATHGAGQNAIEAASYGSRARAGVKVAPKMFDDNEITPLSAHGLSDGADAQANMVQRQKDAWKIRKGPPRSTGGWDPNGRAL